MLELKEATTLAIDLCRSKAKHPDYERVVYLSQELYRPLATGKDIEKLMRRFDPREDEEAFKQRVKITQHTTPATWHTLMNPIRKLESVRPMVDDIEYAPANDKARQDLQAVLSKFRGGKSLDQYLNTLNDQAEIDPNAFELIVFDPFNARIEKPQPYAVSVSCVDAWNFDYFNGELQYLWVHRNIRYIDQVNDGTGKPIMKDGHRFVLYADNHHIVLEQVRSELANLVREGKMGDQLGQPVESPAFGNETGYYLKVSPTEVYKVTFFEQMSGRVPAFRIGSVPDTVTDGRTCVATLHPAVPYLLKSIKQVSELDLATVNHCIPIKYAYIPQCDDCAGTTRTPDGKPCGTCSATPGKKTLPKTAQEIVTFPEPEKGDELRDLSKFMHIFQGPVETIKEMREIVEESRQNCIRAVYASDMYTKDQVNVTATAKSQELDSAYSALRPRVRWKEETKPTAVHVIASYLDLGKNLTVTVTMPQNLKYETVGDMVALGKEAEGTAAGMSVAKTLAYDISERIYADDPKAAKRNRVQMDFDPFLGKSEGFISSAISGGRALIYSEVMFTEAATIWRRAEAENKGPVDLYDLAPEKIETIVYAIRDELVKERLAMQPEPIDMTGGVDEDGAPVTDTGDESTNADPNAGKVQDTGLNGAQVSSLVEIVSLVATSVFTKDTGKSMIKAAFPLMDEGLIDQMLNSVKTVKTDQIKQADAVRDPRNSAGTEPANAEVIA